MKIEINNLSFSYKRNAQLVFDSFSQNFNPGITLLRGFSGCGKSTLLRIIAGYLKNHTGTVTTPSKHRHGSTNYIRKDIGFVFQQLNLLPLASIKRNIKLSLSLANHQKSDYSQWLNRLGILSLQNKTPSELSGGQQQRAAIARALCKSPLILCLDEPTSGLDDLNTEIIKRVLKESIDRERFCLIATHDIRLEEIADDIIDFNHFLPMEEHLQTVV